MLLGATLWQMASTLVILACRSTQSKSAGFSSRSGVPTKQMILWRFQKTNVSSFSVKARESFIRILEMRDQAAKAD